MFLTIIESGPTSFGAFAPDIQGCAAFSVSPEEVRTLFKLAAEAHFRQLVLAGEPLPTQETEGIPGIEIGVPTATITLEWMSIVMPTTELARA